MAIFCDIITAKSRKNNLIEDKTMKIANFVSDILCENQIIKYEDKDVCRYGLEIFIDAVLEILSVIVISIFAGNFWHTIVFFLTFLPLRIYAGGYHADTKLRCYLILLFVYAIFWCIIKFFPEKHMNFLNWSAAFFSSVIIYIFAPIIHKNRKVSFAEKVFYRKISIILMLIETVTIIVGTLIFSNNRFVLSVTMGQLAVSTSMVAAIIKLKLQRRCKE